MESIMKKNSFLLLLAVLGSCLTSFGSEVTLEGPALKRAVHIANPAVELKLEDALAYKTATQNRSAFYQQKLNWKTGDIKQLIVTARFDNPGRLRFAGQTATPEGKQGSVGVYTDVIPDGKYHDYIFNVSAHPGWKGILTNYELRFMGPENTEFALKKIASSANTVIKYMGKTVKRKILTYKTKDLPCNDTLKTQVTGDFGSFYQQKLAWKSDEINTVSFMLKSDAPGSMRFICMLKSADGKQSKAISMPSLNVPGDNEYHLYTFKLDSHPDFNGTLTNYELRFSGSKNATLELQEMTAEKTDFVRNSENSVTAYSYKLKTFSSAGADGIVKCGENVTLKIQALRNGKPITDNDLFLVVKCFSEGEGSKTVKVPANKEFVWSFTRKEPGRAYISCRIKSQKFPNAVITIQNPRNSQHWLVEHGIGIWADPHKQRIQRQEPADFDKFWENKKYELARVPLKVLQKESFDADGKESFDIFDVKIACAGPVPVSGIITIPKNKTRKYPAMVQYHGAGVRSANAYIQPGVITFNVNAHGLPNGKDESFYDEIIRDKNRNPYKLPAEKSVEMFQYMFLRALRALEYVRTLPEWNGKDLIVCGGSQGGVQVLAAAALDKNVTLAVPSIPAMIGIAEFTIRKNVEPAWPNPYTKEFFSKQNITEIAKKFDYVDGAFFMRRVHCPLYVSIGLYDVIAAHVYAAFNDCPAREKVISCIPNMGHYSYNNNGRLAIKRVIEK